jgi:hypothetical protein
MAFLTRFVAIVTRFVACVSHLIAIVVHFIVWRSISLLFVARFVVSWHILMRGILIRPAPGLILNVDFFYMLLLPGIRAFQRLSSGYMLTPAAETRLVASLHFAREDAWIRASYTAMTRAYIRDRDALADLAALQTGAASSGSGSDSASADRVSADGNADGNVDGNVDVNVDGNVDTGADGGADVRTGALAIAALAQSPRVRASAAAHHYHRHRYRQSLAISTALLSAQPHATECVPVHLACLLETGGKAELFAVAHRLAAASTPPPSAASSTAPLAPTPPPASPLPAYAAALYYAAAGSHQQARRLLSRACCLDRRFAPGGCFGVTRPTTPRFA